jgi:hypothetical protein
VTVTESQFVLKCSKHNALFVSSIGDKLVEERIRASPIQEKCHRYLQNPSAILWRMYNKQNTGFYIG